MRLAGMTSAGKSTSHGKTERSRGKDTEDFAFSQFPHNSMETMTWG
jgi:hypothetical protein